MPLLAPFKSLRTIHVAHFCYPVFLGNLEVTTDHAADKSLRTVPDCMPTRATLDLKSLRTMDDGMSIWMTKHCVT